MSSYKVTVVHGPPCAGKTTYVQQNRAPGDLVIDLDALKQAMRQVGHEGGALRSNFAWEARDAIVRRLNRDGYRGMVWYITCELSHSKLRGFTGNRPRFVEVHAPASACRARAARERPAAWLELINAYFTKHPEAEVG